MISIGSHVISLIDKKNDSYAKDGSGFGVETIKAGSEGIVSDVLKNPDLYYVEFYEDGNMDLGDFIGDEFYDPDEIKEKA